MRPRAVRTRAVCAALFAATVLALPATSADAARRRRVRHEPPGHLTFSSPQANPIALSPDGATLLVANTTSNSVDVIDTATRSVVATVSVGLEPVGVAWKPDGSEAWVANHVSDSVSVIDTDPTSSSHLEVVQTIQKLGATGETLFDEPVGLAFASDAKAYVALSSRNQIAVIDTAAYAVTGTIQVAAQEPRAITVANGRLYVVAFESHNQTQVSYCNDLFGTGGVGDPCSLGLLELAQFVTDPNLPGATKNIVVNVDLPDRDLHVYDTSTDALIKTVSGIGTLLYGLAVDSTDRVYVAGTDARNAVNGDHGTVLADLGNEMFDNEVEILDCGVGGSGCERVSTADLDPSPPDPALSLSTPYGVAVSRDDRTIVATAMGSHRLFTMDASGAVLGRIDVGFSPKGVALASGANGAARTAYVLGTLANAVSVVDVSTPSGPSLITTIAVGSDPTPGAVLRGRIAFNDAFGSDSANFSCGSCHPDGNTDQLLWRIGGACPALGCGVGDEPRTTMPIRGLRDSVPLHWDGSLADPYGGGDGSAGVGTGATASCDLDVTDGSEESFPGAGDGDCMRQLVDASLSGVMCDQTLGCADGPSGEPGRMTSAERRDMAVFLARVSYPPARSRLPNDDVSASAERGFVDFFMDRGGVGEPSTCADSDSGCHELPLGTATNSESLGAFDAPTMRGMTDRFVQFSLAPTFGGDVFLQANAGINLFGIVASPLEPSIAWDPAVGPREVTTFGTAFLIFEGLYNVRPLDIFQMFEEASTGHSGALGRQVTLNSRTTAGSLLADTQAMLSVLEDADDRGVVNLRGDGVQSGTAVTVSYLAKNARYRVGPLILSRDDLIAEAQTGGLLVTLTAQLRAGVSEDLAQPLIASPGANCGTGAGDTGDPALPSGTSFAIETKHVMSNDAVFVDGVRDIGASVTVAGGLTQCAAQGDDSIATSSATVTLTSLMDGLHLLQVQASEGLLSNELPFCVGSPSGCNKN